LGLAFGQKGFIVWEDMKLLALIAAALATLSLNCTAEQAGEWHGDARFSEAERAEIVRGVSWMHEQAGLPAPTFDWHYEVTSGEELPKTIRRERGKIGDARGSTGLCSGSTVYLDPVGLPDENMKLEDLAGLAAHEFSHCELGFVDGYHPQDPPTDGIMRVLNPMQWTSAEVKQCADHADRCPAARH